VLGRVKGESGYSLIELLVTMSILSVVVGGLTALFVQGSNAEVDMNRRFQAQQSARVAMDKLRREVHCASAITPSGASASVALTLAATCPTSGGAAITARWCALQMPSPAPTGRFGLYRETGASCTTTSGVLWAEYLTSSAVFNFTVQSTSSLGSLSVDLNINTKPAMAMETFELKDSLVLRNSTRTCITGSPSPPC
jgi:prepilin-type N-terminal cleavage/methylation domain-containing protein